jgi:hypothetical protein
MPYATEYPFILVRKILLPARQALRIKQCVQYRQQSMFWSCK